MEYNLESLNRSLYDIESFIARLLIKNPTTTNVMLMIAAILPVLWSISIFAVSGDILMKFNHLISMKHEIIIEIKTINPISSHPLELNK